ncbi:DNA oxidative demethylase ALKBH2 [Monodelphis domestica]|uniref:DNA oxidative demethylase ALKBH2 n=1 Tax=Monodelphis domestica TaxID=13616 RepID=UPI0024E2308A|nr:DNA oxidative demethylase ALKBH2 [Monodelphis domestica]XP_056677588.1 DNA oxidative demethylase ALKBH2 [Monodelphis domestica]XP_056677589.1 DNA oxidative demethylase ALKBH2 [Monodelphis domestica]XP_056677590.1 DNA oxidative demethylase ALKBH2 [Monodelphis domestica]XP_056677591.1 DNA oxidative demethylase ALKBH2 [Monodelphis domestica]XP_056677592.1 DNA oxidative demethylase ALKBH2 [Monodelphis domestica]XP_056677593.1 DNA oxidative demethylase ALKBH2 [Monodelphis domestica]XP_05667759
MERVAAKKTERCPLEEGKEEPEKGDASQEEEEESRKKRPRTEKAETDSNLAEGYHWQKIQAESLDCDYTVLFSREEADSLLQTLEKEVEYFEGDLSRVHVYGKWHRIPRKQATYGDEGLTYTFAGLTLSPKPWIPVLEHIRDRVTDVTGHAFNFVLINRYKDGCDHIGEHRDDERELAPKSPIASVSFGACRDFFFRHRDSRGKEPSRPVEVVKLQLAHGSLLMMNHPTNIHWYHSLPVRKGILAPRVNLTFRNIVFSKR